MLFLSTSNPHLPLHFRFVLICSFPLQLFLDECLPGGILFGYTKKHFSMNKRNGSPRRLLWWECPSTQKSLITEAINILIHDSDTTIVDILSYLVCMYLCMTMHTCVHLHTCRKQMHVCYILTQDSKFMHCITRIISLSQSKKVSLILFSSTNGIICLKDWASTHGQGWSECLLKILTNLFL